jgi:hypothetical protein
VTRRLKAGIVEPEQTFIARQRLGKHVPAAMNTVFAVRPALKLYNEDPRITESSER